MKKMWLFLIAIVLFASCGVNTKGTHIERTPVQAAKAYTADVARTILDAGLDLKWDDAEIKQSSSDPANYAVRVPIGDSGSLYLHVSVTHGTAGSALLIGYNPTKTSAEIFNLDLHTAGVVSDLHARHPDYIQVDFHSLRILKPTVAALMRAEVAPLNTRVYEEIHGLHKQPSVALLCSAADAPDYAALLSATDNLSAAVNHMYDALHAYEAAAAAMWTTCSACASGVASVCGTCVGLTVAYFAAEQNYNNALDNVDYWSGKVDYYRGQVSSWVASHC